MSNKDAHNDPGAAGEDTSASDIGEQGVQEQGVQEQGVQEQGVQEQGDDLLRIEQVSEQTGLTKRTLRYYEEIGLLAPPARTEGNYRLYTRADVDHLVRIKGMRDLLGASLADIKEMVAAEEERESVRSHYRQTTDPRARLQLLDDSERLALRQLELVEERIAGLDEMRAAIRGRLQKYAEQRVELEARVRGGLPATLGPSRNEAHARGD